MHQYSAVRFIGTPVEVLHAEIIALTSPGKHGRCGAVLDFNVFFSGSLAMLDPKVFEEISARLSALIAASPAADIEKNVRALLSGFFSRLDLVSREEFDVQSQVLQRTREKLDALEKRVAQLEVSAKSPTEAG